jgi:dethiobiotin synthetase
MTQLRLFITGTDTGVGKTYAAVTLIRALSASGRKVAAMKPMASGAHETPQGLRNDDALALLAAMNVRASYDEVNPYCYAPPIAPHIAAAESGRPVDLEVLDRAFDRLALRTDAIIVEGAGGWLAPLDDSLSLSDLAARWRLDVILVVGLRLGCLSHAFLTAEAVEHRGVKLAAWVANSIDPHFERAAENIATLQKRLAAPCLGVLPNATTADAAIFNLAAIIQE